MEVPTIGVRTTATSVGTYGACFYSTVLYLLLTFENRTLPIGRHVTRMLRKSNKSTIHRDEKKKEY